MNNADRSALTALEERVVAELLRKHGRTTSSKVADMVEERAPDLVRRMALPLAHNALVKEARDILKKTTRLVEEETTGGRATANGQMFLEGIADIADSLRDKLPRTIAVPKVALEELLGRLDRDLGLTDDDEDEGDSLGRPPIEFVALGQESDAELDVAIEYMEEKWGHLGKRIEALKECRRWKRRRKAAGC